MKNHRWILNSTGVPVAPADVKATFEKLRDHYADTVLSVVDPRDSKSLLRHDGHDAVVAHMDQGIAALVAITAGMTKSIHATVRGVIRTETERRPGDELVVSVSVAQVGAGDSGIDGFDEE